MLQEFINKLTGEVQQLWKGRLLNADGQEVPDPTPLAPPVGFVRQPSLAEQVRQMVRSERLRAEVEAAGAETFDEADDFDVGDDYDPTSPYEANFEPLTPEDAAALRSQGKDVDGILGKYVEEAPTPPPKPKSKKESVPDDESGTPVSGS